MKSLSEFRAVADRTEEAAFMALRDYLHGRLSHDDMERAIVRGYVAQVELANAEAVIHARLVIGNAQVAKLARLCGVHLGPDLRPDSACSSSASPDPETLKDTSFNLAHE